MQRVSRARRNALSSFSSFPCPPSLPPSLPYLLEANDPLNGRLRVAGGPANNRHAPCHLSLLLCLCVCEGGVSEGSCGKREWLCGGGGEVG